MESIIESINNVLILIFYGAVVWFCLDGLRTLIRWFSGGGSKQMSHDYIHDVTSSRLKLSVKLRLLKSYCKSIVYGSPRKSDLDHELRQQTQKIADGQHAFTGPEESHSQLYLHEAASYPTLKSVLSFDDVNGVLATGWDQEFKRFVLEEYCKHVLCQSSLEYQYDSRSREILGYVTSDSSGEIVRNESADPNFYDLQGYKLVGAIDLVKKVLARTPRGSGHVVKFVNKPEIKPAVRRLLKDNEHKQWWENPGMVVVRM